MSALSPAFNATRALPSDEEGRAFIRAARDNETTLISRMLDTYGDSIVNVKDFEGDTALILAAWFGHTEVVAALLDKGADIEAVNKGGGTALIVAAWHGHIKVVSLLLEKGANIDAKDNDGDTAQSMAAESQYAEVVALLQQWREQRTQKMATEIEILHNGIDHAVTPASRLILRAPRVERQS